MATSLLSTATITSVGLLCKAVFNFGIASVTVNGLPNLVNALENNKRNDGYGVVTVSNHISTLDDPLTWGVLPARYYLSSRTSRWALGASDIMFTNPLGQTIETFRGKGVNQPAVDLAIEKLDHGGWVHLYGEGKVNQSNQLPRDEHGVAHLPRFKWGVGRILMETAKPPTVIPIWLTGFDTLMPEGRKFPYKYFPRPGAQLSVTFGNPIPAELIQTALSKLGSGSPHLQDDTQPPSSKGWIGGEVTSTLEKTVPKEDVDQRTLEILKIRSEVTAIIHDAVEDLGRSICGDTLTRNRTDNNI